jgi:hypothetical protein
MLVNGSNSSPPLFILSAWVAISLILSGCEPPTKPAAPPESATASPPPSKPAPALSTAPEPAPSPSPPPPPAPEPKPAPAFEPPPKPESVEPIELELAYGSVDPILDVRETGRKILISGHLSSALQEKDIVDGLSEAFADYEVESELDVGDHVKTVQGWGNRVTGLLIPLMHTAEDARFHYEGGVVTLEGTVPNRGAIGKLQIQTVEVMEGPDAQGIENKLKVEE